MNKEIASLGTLNVHYLEKYEKYLEEILKTWYTNFYMEM